MENVDQSANTGNQSAPDEKLETIEPNALELRLREVAAENKKFRQGYMEMKQKLDEIEKEKLEAQGQFQEIAKKERERAEAAERLAKDTAGKFGMKLLEMAIETEAAKMGCLDTKALLKLADVNEVEIDDGFNVDTASVRKVLEGMAKDKPYLFQKTATATKDLPPGNSKQTFAPEQKSIKDMSIEEQMKLAAEALMKRRGA